MTMFHSILNRRISDGVSYVTGFHVAEVENKFTCYLWQLIFAVDLSISGFT